MLNIIFSIKSGRKKEGVLVLYYFLLIQTLYSVSLQGTRPIVSLFADAQGASVAVIGFLVSA